MALPKALVIGAVGTNQLLTRTKSDVVCGPFATRYRGLTLGTEVRRSNLTRTVRKGKTLARLPAIPQ
jgi:hypothetical protein